MQGMVPPRRPSATHRCHQTRLPVVGTHWEPLLLQAGITPWSRRRVSAPLARSSCPAGRMD